MPDAVIPETMVLRFRDLLAPTIQAHRELITPGSPYVWWGWWNKPNERIPRNTFSSMLERLGPGRPLNIFLVDSGTQKLYRAALTGIVPAPTSAEIPSPEPARTPEYYRNTLHRAWFRLQSIADASPADLQRWSYAEVAEFTDDPYAERFHDKQVFDVAEMLGRTHRTIYFLQPYRTGHAGHRVELVPPLAPSNFATSPVLTRSSYVLHLSDMHFGAGHHQFALPSGPGAVQESLVTLLLRDLEAQFGKMPPAAVILNGDFTWAGTEEEYGWALDLVRGLRSAYDLTPEQLVMVPGNHDIQWAVDDEGEYDRTRPVSVAADQATRNYRAFYRDVFGLEPDAQLCMGRRIVLKNYVSLDIVGVNSSLLEQKHFAGYGFVSLRQLEHAASMMGWTGDERETRYRVLVLHHHLVPVTAREDVGYARTYSLTLDAAELTHVAMQRGVDLVLHGHMHQPFVAAMSRAGRNIGFPSGRTLAVHGAGSAGVARDHTGAVGKNSYSVLVFDEEGATLRVRSGGESASGFAEDWRCRLDQNPEGGFYLREAEVPAVRSAGA